MIKNETQYTNSSYSVNFILRNSKSRRNRAISAAKQLNLGAGISSDTGILSISGT